MLATMEGERGVGGGGGERGESYAVLSKRWGIEEEGGESQVSFWELGWERSEGGESSGQRKKREKLICSFDASSQDTIDLPTITELRARGENQRFLDDLGYIVDGLQGDSVAVKRPR